MRIGVRLGAVGAPARVGNAHRVVRVPANKDDEGEEKVWR
jgi:hypothetical protein